MLVSLATQLARARRRRQVLAHVPVTTLDSALACLRAAEEAQRGIVFTVTTVQPLLYSLEFMVASLLHMGRTSSVPITVEVVIAPNHHAAEQVLALGAQVVTPLHHTVSLEQYRALISWASDRAAASQAEVVYVVPRIPTTDDGLHALVTDLHGSGAVALRAPLLSSQGEERNRVLRLSLVTEFLKVVRVPVIAAPDTYSHIQLKRLHELRIAGVGLGAELDEAFTGGLRAALHNRSLLEPDRYLPKAQLAVQDNLMRLFKYLGVAL